MIKTTQTQPTTKYKQIFSKKTSNKNWMRQIFKWVTLQVYNTFNNSFFGKNTYVLPTIDVREVDKYFISILIVWQWWCDIDWIIWGGFLFSLLGGWMCWSYHQINATEFKAIEMGIQGWIGMQQSHGFDCNQWN